MRLDHLLSREFFILLRVVRCSALPAPPCLCGGGGGGRAGCGGVVLAASTRSASACRRGVPAGAGVCRLFPPLFDGGVGGGGHAVGFWGGAPWLWSCASGWSLFCSGVGLACVGGLVVICIVDASIFVLCVVIVVVFVWVVLCVCFFGRSVDALASGADEGRGGLR